MDDLIADIQEKTGLSAEKVLEVLTMATDFMKERLPEPLVDQVVSYLGAATTMASEAAGSASGVASVATGAVDKAVETAASVFSKAADVVAGTVAPDDDE